MKKILLLIFVIIIGAFFVMGSKQVKKTKELQSKYKGFLIVDYQLESKNYRLLLADTPEKWERGLMNFRSLEEVDGMIFIFQDKEIRYFWNKNTFMDLQLLWVDGDKVVGKSNLPSIEKSKDIVTVESPVPADKVIEIPIIDKR